MTQPLVKTLGILTESAKLDMMRTVADTEEKLQRKWSEFITVSYNKKRMFVVSKAITIQNKKLVWFIAIRNQRLHEAVFKPTKIWRLDEKNTAEKMATEYFKLVGKNSKKDNYVFYSDHAFIYYKNLTEEEAELAECFAPEKNVK